MLGWNGFSFACSLIATLFFFSPVNGHAYRLGEHKKITNHALQEFNACFQTTWTESDVKTLLKANRNEDLNLFKKWSTYSHYYHPKKKLDMRRKESSVRVLEVQLDLINHSEQKHLSRKTVFKNLGALAHHLQDSTSPPHTVPVSHGLTDQFESFSLKDEERPELDVLEPDCSMYTNQENTSPLLELRRSAEKTLALLYQPIEGTADNRRIEVNWTYFWIPSTGKGFGRYGSFGNQFGDSSFKRKGIRVKFPRETFTTFKADRIRQAIDATKMLFYWYHQKID